jgi:hypothetical protein
MIHHYREVNKIIYIRIFELVVRIASSSEKLCGHLGKPIISQVFSDFFEFLDILTQVTIMDFVVILCKSPYGVSLMNESGFLDKLFDSYGGQNDD